MSLHLRARSLRLFALILCLATLATGSLHAASHDAAATQKKFARCGIDCHVSIRLADHSKVKGIVTEINHDSVALVRKGSSTQELVPLADVRSARTRSSLEGRFQMGPCTGPVTMAIASPFILVAALLGR